MKWASTSRVRAGTGKDGVCRVALGWLAGMVVAASTAACGGPSASSAPPPETTFWPSSTPTEQPTGPSRHIIEAFDTTTSMDEAAVLDNRSKGAQVTRLVGRGGDRIVCTEIRHNSFDPNAADCGTFDIPTAVEMKVCPTSVPVTTPVRNPFEYTPTPGAATPDPVRECAIDNEANAALSGQHIRDAVEKAAAAVADAAIQRDDIGTDLYGAFKREGLLFDGTPTSDHILLVWSDGIDTVGSRVPFDLHGARVVWLVSENDPARYDEVKRTWCPTLLAGGARAVTFLYRGLSAEDIAVVVNQDMMGGVTC